MDLFNLPEKCRQNAIIYYCGSFDPAHEGHLSTVKSAMEKTQAVGAVVIVATGENSDKPNRSSWAVRRQTALELFSNLDNVCVSPWGKDITKKHLLEKAYVINLMGEDIWEKYCKKTKSDFHSICIGLRYSGHAEYTTNLKNTEIIYTRPTVQGCSSSKIRNYLKNHPEIYEGKSPFSGTILDRIPRRELDYIIKNRLYYQSKKPFLREMLGKIKEYITSMLSLIKDRVNKKHLKPTALLRFFTHSISKLKAFFYDI